MAQVQCTKCGQSFDENEQSNWGDFTCSWHPREPRSIGNIGPKGDYAELWYFPCCGKGVVGDIANGRDVTPPRTPGCTSGFHSGRRPQLFLSYARSDSRFAEFLETELKRRGYSVWKDTTDLLPGDNWRQVINEAMDASTHFIILLSPRSIERPEVNRELGAALQAAKPIIPILLETCDIPAQLGSINHIDWREGQDFAYSTNFACLDEALGDPARLQLLKQIRQGRATI
jgi:TIR domain-containing protein